MYQIERVILSFSWYIKQHHHCPTPCPSKCFPCIHPNPPPIFCQKQMKSYDICSRRRRIPGYITADHHKQSRSLFFTLKEICNGIKPFSNNLRRSDLVNGLSKVLDVGGGDTSNGDTAVHGGIDGVLLSELLDLLGLESGVAEHADLGGDVLPVVI